MQVQRAASSCPQEEVQSWPLHWSWLPCSHSHFHTRGRCPECAKGAVTGPGNCKSKPCLSTATAKGKLIWSLFTTSLFLTVQESLTLPHCLTAHLPAPSKVPVPQPCHQRDWQPAASTGVPQGRGSPGRSHHHILHASPWGRAALGPRFPVPHQSLMPGLRWLLLLPSEDHENLHPKQRNSICRKNDDGEKRLRSPSPAPSHLAHSGAAPGCAGLRRHPWISTRSP